MNKIGFQNFRRFKIFEPLEYKGITFLVGRNNSGKSTMVKALLLINEFFKSGSIKTFSFGNNVLEDANIVTYKRALNDSASADYILFSYQIEEYLFEISITSDPDSTDGKVEHISIKDSNRNIHFEIEAKISGITISKINNKETITLHSDSNAVTEAKYRIQEIEKSLQEGAMEKSSKKYISLVDDLNNIKEKLNRISDFSNKNKEKDSEPFSVTTFFSNDSGLKDVIEDSIDNILADHDIDFRKTQKGEKPSKNFPDYRAFKFAQSKIEESFNGFIQKINAQSIIYLGANPSKQSALFAIRDKNNALAQAIHNFAFSNEKKFSEEYVWVYSWMRKFNVGDAFHVYLHAGEAYEVIIATEDSSIQLADLGMGSIQAMLLILRIASIIQKINIGEHNTLVIIEEPELNLHPRLQSQLADFFLEIHEKYKINFIVETHSEYLIRRSQVLVAEKEFEITPNENPFNVYYFPTDSSIAPYKLNYDQFGIFDKNFGDGFFDEASASTLELLKIKRQKQS